MEAFLKQLPKVELHAHINGSISVVTMETLLQKREDALNPNWKLMFRRGDVGTLEDCFKMFSLIHKITDNVDAMYKVTYDVIHEFAADNVKYLELRSTPREVTTTNMTRCGYVEAVLRAIADCEREGLDITVRLLLSIDRRGTVETARDTVNMAGRYRASSGGVVVGVDLSGDPKVGNAADFIPVLEEAQKQGLKLALHLAEVPAPVETMAMLRLIPDRIGHGTCLQPQDGGTQEIVDFVQKHRVPLELCLTSNIVGRTVDHYDNHHFKFWYDQGQPCLICTDDKGVFSTSVSEEYSIAADTFSLSKEQIWDLSYNSIDCIFAEEEVKEMLREKWNQMKPTCFDNR